MKETYRCPKCRALLFKAEQDAIAAALDAKLAAMNKAVDSAVETLKG